jgi:hypothetical protein
VRNSAGEPRLAIRRSNRNQNTRYGAGHIRLSAISTEGRDLVGESQLQGPQPHDWMSHFVRHDDAQRYLQVVISTAGRDPEGESRLAIRRSHRNQNTRYGAGHIHPFVPRVYFE